MQAHVPPRWLGCKCVVAGTGPSLTDDAVKACNGWPTIAVNDAYQLMPDADVLYSGDRTWWCHHGLAQGFRGERWANDRSEDLAKLYNLNIVPITDAPGFSFTPNVIHSGGNSGFQAVNLAILFGATRIVLIGFDMQGDHFFGKHTFRRYSERSPFDLFIRNFEWAAKQLPEHIHIVNATSGSALTCFPMVDLAEELGHADV